MTKRKHQPDSGSSPAPAEKPAEGYYCPLCGEDGGLMPQPELAAHIKQEHPEYRVEWTEHGHGLVTKKP